MASNHVARVTAGGLTNAPIAHSLFGTCETTGITAAKVATIVNGDGPSSYTGNWSAEDLFYGLTINIQFTYKNTTSNPTLNINNSGAKPLMWSTTLAVSPSYTWDNGDVVTLIYWPNNSTNGCWRILQPKLREARQYTDSQILNIDPRTMGFNFIEGTVESSTEINITGNYQIKRGSIIAVLLPMDVPASGALLDENNDSFPIYYKGQPITAGVLKAGDVATFIYHHIDNGNPDNRWELLAVDRAITDSSKEEVSISSTQPTDSNTKIWIKI